MSAIKMKGEAAEEASSNGHARRLSATNNPPSSSSSSSAFARRLSRFSISRPIFSQAKFDDVHESTEQGTPSTPWTKLKRRILRNVYSSFHSPTSCSKIAKKKIYSSFPILNWMPKYNVRENLLKDLIAGLTVGIMNIPQGMAYGKLAEMPHVFGLYTSFFPLILYTLMGTSRHVSVGTFAIVSIMTGKIVNSYAAEEAVRLNSMGLGNNTTIDADGKEENLLAKTNVLITVAFCVGLWQTLLGLIGLGSLSVYLSDQLVKGFTSGAALHVFTSQLKPVFGLKNLKSFYGPFKLIKTYDQFFRNIQYTNEATLIISIVCLTVLLLIKYLINENKRVMKVIKFPVPAELLVVIFGAVASWTIGLKEKHEVRTVSHVPMGMPSPTVPDMALLHNILLETFAIAVVGFSITVSLGKLFAQRFHYEIEPNQELKALGLTNVFCSFFQCIPATGSLARSAVQVAVGGMTQVVSLVAAMFVLVVLLALGYLLEPLPEACLGSIIMVALIGLFKQLAEIGRLWSISFIDTSVLMVSFLAVAVLDVDSGLAVGVAYSLLTVILRTQRPEIGLLGRVPHTDIYKRLDAYRTALEVPHVKIIRLDAPLYFANAEYFRRTTFELCGLEELVTKSRRDDDVCKNSRSPTRHQQLSSPTPSTGWSDVEIDPTVCIIQNNRAGNQPDNSSVQLVDLTGNESDKLHLLLGSSVRYLIFDCSAVCYMDVSGVEMLQKMAKELETVGISFVLASCKMAARETLFLSGFEEKLGSERLYLTVHDAVLNALRAENKKLVDV